VEAIAASDSENIVDDSVALAMKYIFSQLQISELDIAEGLMQLLYENEYDINSLVQSDAPSLSTDLGIEVYVAKIIIDAAKKKAAG
jgi:hypothetical protein